MSTDLILDTHAAVGMPSAPARRAQSGAWRWATLIAVLAVLLLQAGCASTLRSNVTTFQRWPADAQGATFDFRTDPRYAQDLEYQSYQQRIADELQIQGIRLARPGEKPRFWVGFDYDTATRRIQVQEPIFDDRRVWVSPIWVPNVGWRGGYWASDPFGPRVVGSRTVEHDVRTRRLQVEISDGERRVFESTAQTEAGGSGPINTVMPYLIRSVFADFPGRDGQTRTVEFDTETRAIRR
ncbi:uncharacterized protein DUF4136 [Comamonas sp. BIGb0124]|uniref:DUF4136 domain-containing protein n=1 Tax=Comamonas sp. BIGb0124 TaxID=2485130 RepID=UPI000F4977A7|nr:DUF4136 domain-containing protein [Comamonas sp. BIGb0124]ROR16315.1 uncharacterized protein DUF4136 [Comamonas sp. BIGb0124]